jgi:hypothetical protein
MGCIHCWENSFGTGNKSRQHSSNREPSQLEGESMNELVPVVLGAMFGAVAWLRSAGARRVAFSVLAVLIAGVASTIASGEYLRSSAYFLLDIGAASVGVAIGCTVVRGATTHAAFRPRACAGRQQSSS